MKKAFTIIEVVAAIFILSIGIIAVLQLFSLNIQYQTLSQMTMIASQLAQEKIEEISNFSYENLSIGTSTENYGTISNFPSFKRQVVINCIDPNFQLVNCNYNPSNDPYPLKKIDVVVYWRSTFGLLEKNFKITTLIAKR